MATTGTVGTSGWLRIRGPARDILVDPGRPRSAPDAPVERPSGSSTAAGAAPLATVRWAFAFYGGFSFVPLGTIVIAWFTP